MSDIGTGIRSLLEAATELERTLGQVADGEQARHVRTRLRDSVLRPLRQVAGVPMAGSGSATDPTTEPPVGSARPDGSEPDSARQLYRRLPGLARTATELRVRFRDAPELIEATAALQDLAVELAETADAAELLAEFEALQAGLAPQIQPAPNGPYLVTNPRSLDDWLGRPLPVRPQMALCRCGGSQLKPLCDGTHAKIGFTDAKDPGRVPDRRDTYVGPAGDHPRQPRHLPALGPVHRPARHRLPQPRGAVRHSQRRPDGRDHPGGPGLPVRSPQLCHRRRGGPRRRSTTHARRAPTIEVSKDGPYRITGAIPLIDARRHGRGPQPGRVPRALRPVPVRTVAEQTVLQRHALVRRASATRSRTPTTNRPCSSGPADCPR